MIEAARLESESCPVVRHATRVRCAAGVQRAEERRVESLVLMVGDSEASRSALAFA